MSFKNNFTQCLKEEITHIRSVYPQESLFTLKPGLDAEVKMESVRSLSKSHLSFKVMTTFNEGESKERSARYRDIAADNIYFHFYGEVIDDLRELMAIAQEFSEHKCSEKIDDLLRKYL